MGYQGWFETPDEGSGLSSWRHWSNDGGVPVDGNLAFDLFPDMEEYSGGSLSGDTGLMFVFFFNCFFFFFVVGLFLFHYFLLLFILLVY